MSDAAGLAAKLRIEGEKLSAFFSGIPQSDWQREVYSDGAIWTVRSVLAHLVTSERAFLDQLFPNVLERKGGASAEFSVDRFNARQQEKMLQVGPGELLEAFGAVRARLADWVSSLSEQELETAGRHPYLGQSTLREMIKMVYLHNMTHYRDVRRALR